MNKHINNICICGHLKEKHKPSYSKNKMWDNSTYKQDACYAGFDDQMPCNCYSFKLDNLRYLEQLSGSM